MSAADIVDALRCGRSGCACRAGTLVHCPVPSHGTGNGDRNPSLSVAPGTTADVMVHCFTGCTQEAVLESLRLQGLRAPADGGVSPSADTATLQPSGCTLEAYATAKRLDPEFLRSLGVTEVTYDGRPALRIGYVAEDGTELATRFRIGLHSRDRFRWKRGSRLALYGLNRLPAADHARIVLVEGESDCHVAWAHHLDAVGVPGASNFRDDRDAAPLRDFERIYLVLEPDRGGEQLLQTLARSVLRDQVHLVRLEGFKDLAELHVADPDQFLPRWQRAVSLAVPLTQELLDRARARRAAAAAEAELLINRTDILDEFARDLRRLGVVGEERTAKILFLAAVSRVLARPMSVAVKGPSSAGKSYVVEQTLRFFPEDAYYAVSGMSEHALVYGQEPLEHRMLVIYEAAGIGSEFGTYALRSLLSEGHLRYETVVKTPNGMEPRLIERSGPTGLIVTTTAVNLHPENETRMLSLTLADTREQTAAVLRSLAVGPGPDIDFGRWHALQDWLSAGSTSVAIPYAEELARCTPPVAVRLRRDFAAILNLIRAHALLHQGTRSIDTHGAVVATLEDYAAVRALVADVVSDGIGAAIPATVRETVAAVADLSFGDEEVRVTQLAERLGLDKSAAQRRVASAIERGYLRNLEDRRGRPARLVLGDPLPGDVELLPSVERLQGCSASEGDPGGSPPVAIGEGGIESFVL